MNNPYIMDPAVGDSFYGRQWLIEEILGGEHQCMLIIGARRIGKTSLLKEIENQLNGTYDIGICLSLDALAQIPFEEIVTDRCDEKSEYFKALGINIHFNRADGILGILQKLDSSMEESGTRLFLLFDESESLGVLGSELLLNLRVFFETATNTYLILSASQNIRTIAKLKDWLNPPFMSEYPLGPLENPEAEALIRQNKRVDVSNDTLTTIQEKTGNQPYLIQLLCYEIFHTPNRLMDVSPQKLDNVYQSISTASGVADPILANSFNFLSSVQQSIITHVSVDVEISEDELNKKMGNSPEGATTLRANLEELTALGYIKINTNGKYSISNYFLEKWLNE